MNDREMFDRLIEMAKNSKDPDGVVVAGLIEDGKILFALPSADDGIRHAEDMVIEQVKAKNIKIGESTILYTTVEPCTFRNPAKKMTDCATLIINSGIKNVVFSIHDPKYQHNSEEKLRNAGIDIRQVEDEEIKRKSLELYSRNFKKSFNQTFF